MTLRDKVWNEVIEVLTKEGKFKISELNFDESQRHTVRRVLKNMERQGFLRRETEHAKIWRAGPRAKELLDLSERARVLADED